MCPILNFLKLIQVIFVMLHFQVILLSCWRVADANVSCIDKERQALLDFKHALLDEYGRLSSWGNTQDCCNWMGVQCNLQIGHVEMLDLYDSQFGYQPLRGEISTSLMELQHLKYLNLGYNNFNGSYIPEFFGCLTKLTYLNLSAASFGGIIPYQLGKLSSLQVLDLHSNNLTGKIPYQFGNLSSLQKLNLNNNYLVSTIPYQFGNLSCLRILWLGYNDNLKIDYKSLMSTKWISNLPSLTELDLSFVSNLNSSSSWLQQIGELPNLRKLSLQNCYLTNINLLSVPPLHLNFSTSLVTLVLSDNKFTSSIFQWLFNLSSNLIHLSLSKNQLTSPISEDFWKTMNNLEVLDLSYNQLNETISDIHFDSLTKLQSLDLSSNSLTLKFSSNWIPPFQLKDLWLRQCKLGPSFPNWLQNQHTMRRLEISNAGIFDSIPMWFWSLTVEAVSLAMSSNNFTGIIVNQQLKFTYHPRILLSFNQIEGPIPSFLLSTSWLDLSNNKFSKLPPLCDDNFGVDVESLEFLDLSNNQISGKVPDCWSKFKSLKFLNLFNNKLSGRIPISMGSLVQMQVLCLSNNEFIGGFPSLENCTNLKLLDLGGNQLSGSIHSWIWDSPGLDMLILRKNKFSGSLPTHLCHAKSIQVLDLSFNILYGGIPRCLNNFTTMTQKNHKRSEAREGIFPDINDNFVGVRYSYDMYLVWKSRETVYPNTNEFLNMIDLSHNQLSGKIPTEIASLVGLVSLNLSANNLSGEIISQLAELKSLEVLDLSRNRFSGRIPSTFSEMYWLNSLNLSNNNLSGEIPIGTQLQSFDASSYEGNPYLCGRPLGKACPSSSHGGQEEFDNEDEDEDEDSLLTPGFYTSMGLGFFTGFWGVFGSILFNRSWRHAYFNFLKNLMDKIYMTSILNIARLRRWFKT